MSGATCDLVNYVNVGTNTTYSGWTPATADSLVTWKIRANNGALSATSASRTMCIEGFDETDTDYVSAWSAACGYQTRTCTEDCGTDDCDGVIETNCQHCEPTIGEWTDWTSCGADHTYTRSSTRTCTENDGLCDGDDCLAFMTDPLNCPAGSTCTYDSIKKVQTKTEDCVGTITGTFFDASDLDSCDLAASPPTFGSQAFGLSGTWGLLDLPVETRPNGTYSERVYAPGVYSFDYSLLIDSGLVTGVKFECEPATVTVTEQGEVVTKNTGFWRTYSGWWQVVGGSVYAASGITGHNQRA